MKRLRKIRALHYCTVEPRCNEPLFNEVLDVTNDLLCHSNSKIYEKEPRYNKISLWRTYFASPLGLSYIEVPLYNVYRKSLASTS